MVPYDESAIAKHRVERLLSHFRRFLAPDDENILKLEERLSLLAATLQAGGDTQRI